MKIQLTIKYILDRLIAFIGIIVLIPIFIIISFVIKFDSKGPIIFSQQRLGKNGAPFNIHKFRTMVVGAEKTGDGLRVRSNTDARITKTGNFLRKTSLDELPQLFNILKGEMSLVGPRPPVTYHPYDGYLNYPEWTKKRFIMKPGVTGFAQVKVRNAVSWDGRIEYDNKYVDEFSLWLDLKILLITVKKIINPSSIYLGEK